VYWYQSWGPSGNLAKNFAWFQEVSSHSRVFFWGEGSDNALVYEWRPYLKFLIGRGRYLRALRDICRHVIDHRRIPLLPSIPRMVRARLDPDFKLPSFPPWLNPEFESRYGLRARWEDRRAKQTRPSSLHPVRPDAYESFTGPLWQALFEGMDSGNTRAALEARYPFMDLPLVRYMLAVPAMPWCRVKYLQRQAMRGILPEPVRRRLKTILRGDPVWDRLRGSKLPDLACAAQTQAYVSLQLVPESTGQDRISFYRDLAPRGLDYWLQNGQEGPTS
jgi:asparagine synthase (glutamine-hydrolysing)